MHKEQKVSCASYNKQCKNKNLNYTRLHSSNHYREVIYFKQQRHYIYIYKLEKQAVTRRSLKLGTGGWVCVSKRLTRTHVAV